MSTSKEIEKMHKDNVTMYSAAALSFFLLYIPSWIRMWERWFARDSYYSHGVLIPLVSIFLLLQQRKELSQMLRYSSRWGLPLIILGCTVHVVSSLFRVNFVSGFSMLITLAGLILHFAGGVFLKKILFPIGFLVFMIPLPEVVITNLSINLKFFAASVAATILNQIRLPAIQAGSLIKMESSYVVVDDVCSGLRSLISLIALASIFSYWLKGHIWKKIFVVISAIPLAVVTNTIRIVFLASVSEIWGAQYATGFLHDLSGFLVFGIAFLLLHAVVQLIE